MNFNGHVIDFNSSEHSYLINFKLSSENIQIPDGSAKVQLKIGETKVNILNPQKHSMDSRTSKLLKIKFLEAIYDYNKAKNPLK